MGQFTMPALGADMTEGTLLEWLVGPGDTVRKGDPVAVVGTAKSAIEVECFESGTVERLLVEKLSQGALCESCFARGCKNEDQEQTGHGPAGSVISQNSSFLRTRRLPPKAINRPAE